MRHSKYDLDHSIHRILLKALKLLKRINNASSLRSRIGTLLLDFPDLRSISIAESTFDKIHFNRKFEPYRKAIAIAKFILLNYHPDLQKGRNDVLALMFDMNLLWEQFVYVSLRKNHVGRTISAQTSKYFWKPKNGNSTTMIPDIVINKGYNDCVVLDTKWKNLGNRNPSPEDLRQMYVYSKYYQAKKVGLIYPGENKGPIVGKYFSEKGDHVGDRECSVLSIEVDSNIGDWQINIHEQVARWYSSVEEEESVVEES